MEKLIESIKNDGKLKVDEISVWNLIVAMKLTENVEGDVAELGVWMGGTAKILLQAKKTVHLFDTFEGLPRRSKIDDHAFRKGKYKARLEDVQRYLKDYPNAVFHKGFFPDTATGGKFSLVHLDADLYQSTKDAIEYFYPRLSKGGIIISHDYPTSIGVQRAFEEAFGHVFTLVGSQAMMIKP